MTIRKTVLSAYASPAWLAPGLIIMAIMGWPMAAAANLSNSNFAAEATFDEAAPPTGWLLRDQEARALISRSRLAYSGQNLFRFETLQRGFGGNKLEQCVPVTSGEDFEFGVWVRTPMPDEGLGLRLNIEFYTNTDNCLEREDRLGIGNDDFDFALDMPANIWTEFRSEPYDGSDLSSAGARVARISVRARDRSDEGNPADPPRVVYLDHLTGPDGELLVNGNFSEVSFPESVSHGLGQGPLAWVVSDVVDEVIVGSAPVAASGSQVSGQAFRFTELGQGFGDNKLDQCVALSSGAKTVELGVKVLAGTLDDDLRVRLNTDFYATLEDCLSQEERLGRADTDFQINEALAEENVWTSLTADAVDLEEVAPDAAYVRVSLRARNRAAEPLSLWFAEATLNTEQPQLTGAWYDPSSDGQGLNLQLTQFGLFGFYYGYDESEQLWLELGIHPGAVAFGQPFEVPVYGPAGGTFGAPDPVVNGPMQWGRLVMTIESCTEAQASLSSFEGLNQELSLTLLAGPGLGNALDECLEPAQDAQPNVGLTGAWFDPETDGQGWNLLHTNDGVFGFFYGYSEVGAPRWLIADTEAVALGEAISFDLRFAEGGTFDDPVAPAGLQKWGTVTFNFDGCQQAEAVLEGEDGSQTQQLVKLADTEGLPGCE